MSQKLSLLFIAALVSAWITLFFSGRGLVVWYTTPDGNAGMLECQYFTGVGLVERRFLYTKSGLLGRETCPRFVELD